MTGKARFPTWMPGDIRIEWRRYMEANERARAAYRAKTAALRGADTRRKKKAA